MFNDVQIGTDDEPINSLVYYNDSWHCHINIIFKQVLEVFYSNLMGPQDGTISTTYHLLDFYQFDRPLQVCNL